MKKQTIIIGVFIRENSAITDYFFKLANEFINLNYKVIVVANEHRNDLVGKIGDVDVLTWPSYHPTKIKDFLFIRKVIKKEKPILMISNFGATNFFLMAGKLYGVPHRIPWIHTVVSAFLTEIAPWKFWRKRYIYKLATHFIANSNATKKDAIDKFRIEEKQVTVVPNLIYNSDSYLSKEKENTIVFVGRFHESKGIDTLIMAMKIVIETVPDLKLKIIGGGDDTKYKKMVESFNLDKNIIFLGRMPHEEVFKHLSKAQCSIVPSVYEAFGYVVIESFAVKTPVIGSDTGGISEIITDNVDGMLFPVKSHTVLAEKIIKMISNKELLTKYSENAYETFKSRYDLDSNIYELREVLTNLLAKNS